MLCVTLFDKEQSQSLFHFYMALCTVAKETALSVSQNRPMDNFSDYIVCCPLNVDKNICFLLLLILVNCGNYYL